MLPVFPLSPRIDNAGGTPGRQRAASHAPLRRASSRTPRRATLPMDVDEDNEASSGNPHGHARTSRGAGNSNAGEKLTQNGGVAAASASSAPVVPNGSGDPATPPPAPPPPQPHPQARPPRQTSAPPGGRRPRVFCPVPNCLHANHTEAAGWDSVANMRDHLDAHNIGDIPLEWRLAHRLVRCEDCGRLVVGPPGTRHPTCRAQRRMEHSQAGAAEQATANHFDPGRARPTADTVLRTRRPTLRHVPKCCRDLWATALTRVFATAHLATLALGDYPSQEATLRCEEAWLDVLLLPKCVLCPSARSGRRHRKLTGQHTRARLNRWLAGERLSLWEDSAPKKTTVQAKRTAAKNGESGRWIWWKKTDWAQRLRL
jgi:hypothetical protein